MFEMLFLEEPRLPVNAPCYDILRNPGDGVVRLTGYARIAGIAIFQG